MQNNMTSIFEESLLCIQHGEIKYPPKQEAIWNVEEKNSFQVIRSQ